MSPLISLFLVGAFTSSAQVTVASFHFDTTNYSGTKILGYTSIKIKITGRERQKNVYMSEKHFSCYSPYKTFLLRLTPKIVELRIFQTIYIVSKSSFIKFPISRYIFKEFQEMRCIECVNLAVSCRVCYRMIKII